MIDRKILRPWILEALRMLRGSGSVVEVSRLIWQVHEADLRASGDLFYTWQYDVRWQAQALRDNGYLQTVEGRRNVPWELTKQGWETDLTV